MFSTIYLYLMFGWKIITSALTLLISYHIYNFYLKLSSMPPGPTPLPLIGNILSLGGKKHWTYTIEDLAKKYGSIFTLWIGNTPTIMITDFDLAKQTFCKINFSYKHPSFLGSVVSRGKHSGILFRNPDPEWDSLRRITHSAVEFIVNSDQQGNFAIDSVDHTFRAILNKEGIERPFDPAQYFAYLFINLTMMTFFRERYDFTDEEYLKLKYLSDFKEEVGKSIGAWEISKFFRILDYKLVKNFENKVNNCLNIINEKIEEHLETFDELNIRDGCDAFITAYRNLLKNNANSENTLCFEHVANTMVTSFIANIEGPQTSFLWFLLYLLHFPDVHKKVVKEIEREIGDRIPTKDDKNRCHYVMAFISESIRFSGLTAVSTAHKPSPCSKIGEYDIPENANLVLCLGSMGKDHSYWTNPEKFYPDRFIVDGKYVTSRPRGFIPFSIGQRNCLGEKLVWTQTFIILVRFLQKVSENKLDIELTRDGGLDANPDIYTIIEPNKYQIKLKSIN